MNRLKAMALAVILLVVVLFVVPGTASGAEASVNLIFMHHSVGSDWLSRGLCAALNASDYHVADTNYGWTGGSGHDYGSSTDTGDWPSWFNDTVMGLAYPWMSLSSGTNTLDQAPGENTIVMFKSCFPNSDVGNVITDEQAIYNSLLPYFEAHPDKMFVLITPPPMQSISYPLKTRELCNWLTDRENGWLKNLATSNVFVFDFYNVLTAPGAHHYISGGVETHTVVPGANTLYYDSSGDDHPNAAGDAKATAEFVPLLNAWYEEFLASSGTAPLRVQQNDPRITYLGTWGTRWTGSASGGSFNYSNMTGAAALVSFEGTSIELFAKKGSVYGEATITLDGDDPVKKQVDTVDFYNASDLFQEPVYKKEGLLNMGPHTLVIRCAGPHASASSDFFVSLDALRVVGDGATRGSLTQAPTPARNQQEDVRLKYKGAWSTTNTWSSSGGSFASADSPGSAVNVTFDGTYLAWVAKKGPAYGKAFVSLDGGPLVTVDLYSGSDRYKQRVYDTGLLEDGVHTLSIYWSGQKNPASYGTRIDVDTVDLFGDLAEGSEPLPITWRYQQNDARLTYLGDWSTGATWSASGGSLAVSGAKGAAVVAGFTGTSVKLLARTGPSYGVATITLDGTDVQPVDFYSLSQRYKQVVYTRERLSPGPHTLTIKCAGTNNPPSTGLYIDIDALDITGYLTQAPRTTRVQQDDARFAGAFEGPWVTATTWSSSGGSHVYADAAGARVTVVFTGTYLAWLTKTSPYYGKARVTLDGVAVPGDVDLYSRSTVYKNRVYNTGLLPDTSHTLVIEYTGTKRPAALGKAIGVDAFDILFSDT